VPEKHAKKRHYAYLSLDKKTVKLANTHQRLTGTIEVSVQHTKHQANGLKTGNRI
jgi:hypothetical protein